MCLVRFVCYVCKLFQVRICVFFIVVTTTVQRKRAKMQWVQNPCQSNVDNLNSVRREVSRHFRNKKKEYLRAKFEELVTNSKIHNIRDLYRGINDFKKGYQPRCNIVEDEKVDLVADTHSIVVGGGTISPSYSMCMGLRMLGRQKYTQQNHWYLSQMLLRLSWLSSS